MSSPLPRPFIPPHAMEADSPRLRARTARRPAASTREPDKKLQRSAHNKREYINHSKSNVLNFGWVPIFMTIAQFAKFIISLICIYICIFWYIILWEYYQGFRGMEICKEMIAWSWELFHAGILALLIAWWDSSQDSWSGRTICIMHHHSSSCASPIIIHRHPSSSIIIHH